MDKFSIPEEFENTIATVSFAVGDIIRKAYKRGHDAGAEDGCDKPTVDASYWNDVHSAGAEEAWEFARALYRNNSKEKEWYNGDHVPYWGKMTYAEARAMFEAWLKDPPYKEPPYDEIDTEIVDLVIALNAIDGIETVSSCFGHGTEPCRILFNVKEWGALIRLTQRLAYETRWRLWVDLYGQNEINNGQDRLLFILDSQTVDYDDNLAEVKRITQRLTEAGETLTERNQRPFVVRL